MDAAPAGPWCDCDDAPDRAIGPATLLDHPEPCEFPEGVCSVLAHRTTVHARCGRPLLMRYCGCGQTGFTLDTDRGWWVCFSCGWPTRAWFSAAGTPAPAALAGLRPVTYHDYAPVTGTKKDLLARLGTEARVELNRRLAGQPVRD